MKNQVKIGILVLLILVIAASLYLTRSAIVEARRRDVLNPNVTLVTAPQQEGFEEHSEWTVPVTEPVDYGENLALDMPVKQSSQTQIYNGRNAADGDVFTYWEGAADSYPNALTIDLGTQCSLTGTQLFLNPRQIWSARTQEVEILVSSDGEKFTTVVPKAGLNFDPLENNSVYVAFDQTVTGQYVQYLFYSNSGATAGQAAEIEIYGSRS